MFHVIVDELCADLERRHERAILERQKAMYPDCEGYTIYKHCTKELSFNAKDQ